MSTIKDVARVAGVSIATVSRVINKGPKVSEKKRALVLKVMKELNYSPNANARALVTQDSGTMGVVIPDLADPFFAALASGVDKVAREQNMQLLLSTGKDSAGSEQQAIELLIEQRCSAFVVHSKLLDDNSLNQLAADIPGLVLIDRFLDTLAERSIWLDNREGGRIAARHFLSLGHRDFACITSRYPIDDPALRLEGFNDELSQSDGALDQCNVVAAEPNYEGGEVAVLQLLASGKPFSAVFVYNDAMAIGAISALQDNGLDVPGDVSVIGFDDVLLSRYSRPKLTTLHYPVEDMAIHAANLAVHQVRQSAIEIPGSEQKYIPRLVKRGSTATFRNLAKRFV